jgi:L-threonylcarbamoyladenylate synthase
VRLIRDPRAAAKALIDGHLVALPTETVYGLGADARNPAAVDRLFAVKGRPTSHPVIVHVVDAAAANRWATAVPDFAQALMTQFWPGPLTVVLPRSAHVPDSITGGQDSVALRVPAHPLMQSVLNSLAELSADPAAGIVAPSANRFGHVSPTTTQHVLDELQEFTTDDDCVLDGGPCVIGVESTIVDCTGTVPGLLRSGAITIEEIEAVTGLTVSRTSKVRAPGTLDVHYAPRAEVLLVSAEAAVGLADTGAGFLAEATVPTPPGMSRLAAPRTSDAYAKDLYAALRLADEQGLSRIYVVPPPPIGIGIAIQDRLTRAATNTT